MKRHALDATRCERARGEEVELRRLLDGGHAEDGREDLARPGAERHSPEDSDGLEEPFLVAADHLVRNQRLARDPAAHLTAAVVVDHAAEERQVWDVLHEAPVLA